MRLRTGTQWSVPLRAAAAAATGTNGAPAHESRLLRPAPPAVQRGLERAGVGESDLVLCTPTDIDRLGAYRPQWLVATRDRLWIFPEDPLDPDVTEVPIAHAAEFRTIAGVGSGTIAARLDGAFVDLLRYSNRQAYRFERVAAKLEQLRRGETVRIAPEDEHDPRRCPRCAAVLDQPGDPCGHCVSRGAVLTRMIRLMRPYRGRAITMMLLLLVGIALDLVSPQLTRYLVDEVLPGNTSAAAALQADPVRFDRAAQLLLSVVLVLGLVQAARMVVNIINGRLGSRVGTAITFDMRDRLVQHLLRLSVGFYDKQQVGSLMGRVAYDTEALHGFVWQLTGGFLLQILMVVGVAIMMFSIDVNLALYALLPAPLVMGGTIFFWRYVYPRYYVSWDASSKQAGTLSGMLAGMRVVKAFSQEGRELDRFNSTSGRLRRSKDDVDRSIATFNPVIGLVFQIGGWIVWYVGGREVIEARLTLGELMAFFGYLWMFYGPLAALPQFTNWLTAFATQANRIFEILDTPAAIAEPPDPVPLRPIKGDIAFEHVAFGYAPHNTVLRDVNLHIRPGEMVGIVGGSGSGKSTLVNLLCRFYDVDQGRVAIDGVDVRNVATGELRSQVGVVLQEPFLFRGSITDNLVYGRPEAQPEEILAASKAANCHDFIMRQPYAYDTWVGERGAGLSGGERQRISIARVLLTDPRILILDEATSSVDAESEAAIQAALREVVRGRTTIAIAHRLSTLRLADRIMVVDAGRIAETGTHRELLAKNGLYARLVRLQNHAGATAVDLAHRLDIVPGDEATPLNDGSVRHAHHATDYANQDPPLPPIGSHQVRWLEPEFAQIHLGNWNSLHVTIRGERIYGGVFALRCMPVRYPAHFISLRHLDAKGREEEIGVIRYLPRWPEEAQRLVRETLLRRYFVHTVFSFRSITQRGNYLTVEADTDLGPVTFTLRAQNDRAQDFGARGKILIDTDENRYLVPDVEALTDRDRRLFRRYIYW